MHVAAPGRFQALLFDLDGTLIDSMPLHERAWARWFALRGRREVADEAFFVATAGRTAVEILRDLYPEADLPTLEALADEREGVYREIARTELQLIRGALDLLQRARTAGLRLAVCTAAPPANIALAFERFGLGALVDTVASPADGLRGKPHPDIFEAAAQRLGAAPEHCLVFEDAPLGLEAARRAGMPAIALSTTLPASAFDPYPNRIGTVSDFTALDPSLLFA